MKYGKLIKRILAHRSANKAQVAVALVAGLVAGAVISILFAPDSGVGTRGKIASGAKKLSCGFQDQYGALKDKVFGTAVTEEETLEEKAPIVKNKPAKKPKSDVKEIIEQAHKSSETEKNEEEA